MTILHPRRLRAQRTLPPALHEALRELPNSAPEPTQLEELRQKLGLAARNSEGAMRVPDRRLKERRLRRTVAALVFFPIAATAAVGTVADLRQRSAQSAAAAASSEAAQARSRSAASGARRASVPALPPATSATTAATTAAESLTAPDPVAVPARLQRTAPSAALSNGQRDSAPRLNEPDSTSSITEIELLQRANAALKISPAQALSLTSEHRQLFPTGNLGQEREVIAIKAMVLLGDSARARESLSRFERAYPRSLHVLELHQIVR